MRLARLLPVLLAGGLAACAASDPATSYVAPSLAAQSGLASVAGGIASVAATVIPAGGGAIYLEPATPAVPQDRLAFELAYQLRLSGFTVTDQAKAAAHRLRYWLTPLETGVLVRVAIDGQTRAARFFAQDVAGVRPAGPITVESITT